MKTRIIEISLLSAIILSACNLNLGTTLTPVPPTQTGNTVGNGATISLDVTGVGQSYNTVSVGAVPAAADANWWQINTEYTRYDIVGYAVSNSQLTPQVFLFPVTGLAGNPEASKVPGALKMLIQFPQEIKTLPMLPLFGSVQVMNAQFHYLDIKNGQGMRFLTQYNSGIVPVNNAQLFYTYQGLTSDGLYYVAVVAPVNLSELPLDATSASLPADWPASYQQLLSDTIKLLNEKPASAFTPDLALLDAMVRSIEVK
jgi:hypothetical protein